MKQEVLWTLAELAAEVAAQLQRNYQASGNGQVRAVPDERAIRYYTSIGLVDRPASMRGRTALYGRRHLAQLVAIKRLQALDKPLAEIQKLLPTLDDKTLARIAGVMLPTAERGRREDFWRERVASASAAKVRAEEPAAAPSAAVQAATPLGGFDALWTLTLASGVTLTLQSRRAPTEADADAVLNAARPLLDELLRRGMIQD
jgi:DNA-binding transcriptional MerR regulator